MRVLTIRRYHGEIVELESNLHLNGTGMLMKFHVLISPEEINCIPDFSLFAE